MSEKQPQKTKEKNDDFLMQGMILAIAMVMTKVIGVLYRIPLTNILGDAGNGFYGYAYEVYAMALMLSSFSLPTAVSKLVSERMAKRQRRNAFRVFICSMVFSVIVGIAIALLIFFGADFISVHIMESPLSAYALKVLASGLFIVAVLGVLRGYFQGLGTMIPTAVSQIIEQVVNAVVSIAGASVLFKMGTKAGEKAGEELLGPAYGAAGGTLGTVGGALFALLFLLFVFYAYHGILKKQLQKDKSRHRESYRRILKILLITIAPVIFSTAIYNINQILDLTIFNKIMVMQGYTEKEYMALQGIYTGKYNTLINVPLAMANGLAASVISSLAAAVAAGKKGQIHGKIEQTIRLTMLIAIPCFAGFVVLASPIMVFIYGDASFTPAALLAAGAVTVILYCLSTVTNSILQGLDQMAAPARNAGISLVIHLAALFLMLGVFKWNIFALVGSNIVFSICMCILNMRDIYNTCGYRQEIKKTFLLPLAAAGIMGVAAFGVYHLFDKLIGGRFIPVIIAIMIAVVVYVVGILKFGVLTEEEILMLPMGGRLLGLAKKFHLLTR